jgi:hypothetical protein
MSQTVLAYAGLGGGAGAAGAAPPGGGGGGGARSTLALARECVMRAKPEEILDGTATLPEDALLFVVRWLCQLGQWGGAGLSVGSGGLGRSRSPGGAWAAVCRCRAWWASCVRR